MIPTITTQDIIHAYWTQQLKPVFKYKTLLEGLLKTVIDDPIKGFDRGILQYQLECLSGEPRSP